MIANLAASASGVLAAQEKHAATSVNVANVSNDKAARRRVDLAPAAAQAGVTATHRVMDPAGSGIVDDMAEMSLTNTLYTANLAVIEVQSKTAGTLLDIFA